DHLWCIQLNQLLQAVVAVDDAAVQIIEVTGCKATTRELHHGTQVRRNYAKYANTHARRLNPCTVHTFQQAQTFHKLLLTLALGLFCLGRQIGSQLLKVNLAKQLFQSSTTHTNLYDGTKFVGQVSIITFINERKLLQHAYLDLQAFEVLVDLAHFLGAHFSQSLDVGVIFLGFLLIADLDGFPGSVVLGFAVSQQLVALFGIYILDDIGGKVCHALEVLYRHAQQKAHSGWRAAQEPDVCYRRCQGNVAHALAADNRTCHQLAVLIDGSFARADALIFCVVRIDVLDRSKYTFTEQTVTLRLLGPIVDGLGFGHLTVAPLQNVGGAGDGKTHCVELGNIRTWIVPTHYATSSSLSFAIASISISSGFSGAASPQPSGSLSIVKSSGAKSSSVTSTSDIEGCGTITVGSSFASLLTFWARMSSASIARSECNRSTFRPSPCSSFTSTLKLSGTFGPTMSVFLMIDS